MNVEIVRDDPEHYCVSLPVRHSQIPGVISVLNLLGVPSVKPPGGAGWLLGDGSISISGRQQAVENAVEQIAYKIEGPRFVSGLDIAARHTQGALP